MKRVNRILKHPQYIGNLNKIMLAEKEREFCRHNLQHFLDVARVAYIKALEDRLQLEKEVIYATALLHDIGRWKQYEDGSDHALVSAQLARPILVDCGFGEEEIQIILQAIEKHRRGSNLTTDLDRVIYGGDKTSRPCQECKKIAECNRLAEGEEVPLIY